MVDKCYVHGYSDREEERVDIKHLRLRLVKDLQVTPEERDR